VSCVAPYRVGTSARVASRACVRARSNLNNQTKGIDDGGESGQTFRGMQRWIESHKPPVVILENVCSAPWEQVRARARSRTLARSRSLSPSPSRALSPARPLARSLGPRRCVCTS
jgi:hypothetical protein